LLIVQPRPVTTNYKRKHGSQRKIVIESGNATRAAIANAKTAEIFGG